MTKKSRIISLMPALMLGLLGPNSADAQAGEGRNGTPVAGRTSTAKPGATVSVKKVEVSRKAPVSGQTIKARNGEKVTITLVHKSPFETCTMDSKRDAVEPESSAVAQLISLGMAAAGTFTGFTVMGAPIPTTDVNALAEFKSEAKPNGNTATGRLILGRLDELRRATADRKLAIEETVKAYQANAKQLKGFFQAEPDPRSFETSRKASKTLVDGLLKKDLWNTVDLELAYKTVTELTAKYDADVVANEDDLRRIHLRIVQVRRQLDVLASTLTDLTAARTKLSAVADYLDALEHPEWEKAFELNADRDAKVTGSISCSDTQTKEVTLNPVYFTVTYQNLARFTMSGGVLFSLVPKQTFAINPVLDSRPAGAVATFHNELTKESSRPQLVPFSLGHLRLRDWKVKEQQFTFNYAGGFGVNPNGGTTETEFAPVGISLGIGSFYVSAVGHWARTPELSGGFRVGDTVSGDIKSPPLTHSWNPGFAFGITYKLPLPK